MENEKYIDTGITFPNVVTLKDFDKNLKEISNFLISKNWSMHIFRNIRNLRNKDGEQIYNFAEKIFQKELNIEGNKITVQMEFELVYTLNSDDETKTIAPIFHMSNSLSIGYFADDVVFTDDEPNCIWSYFGNFVEEMEKYKKLTIVTVVNELLELLETLKSIGIKFENYGLESELFSSRTHYDSHLRDNLYYRNIEDFFEREINLNYLYTLGE
jgi:hypothetical protein